MKKRVITGLLLAALLLGTAGCAGQTEQVPTEKSKVSLAVLAGPTGMGAAKLLSDNAAGLAANEYTVTVAAAPDELTGKLVSGEVQVAALPTNLAAALYNKTNGAIQIAALNTLGVLYILENGNTVQSMADLKGRTIYATGQAANPEYVLNFLLRENGLEPGKDVTIEYKAADQVAAMMATGEASLCMLPVPAATGVLLKNSAVRQALDLTAEWEKTGADGALTMGCIAVRRDFAEQNSQALGDFLSELEASVQYVTENQEAAAKLITDLGIVGSEAIAKAAIPDAGLVFLAGDAVKEKVGPYYEVLYDADPASVGGKVPDDAFYYVPQ
jgi:NitT/TauT family transport system substrate-binding protein